MDVKTWILKERKNRKKSNIYKIVETENCCIKPVFF